MECCDMLRWKDEKDILLYVFYIIFLQIYLHISSSNYKSLPSLFFIHTNILQYLIPYPIFPNWIFSSRGYNIRCLEPNRRFQKVLFFINHFSGFFSLRWWILNITSFYNLHFRQLFVAFSVAMFSTHYS